jgi:hypothetical protein
MRDSNVVNAAKETAQAEFPHGLLEFCPTGFWRKIGAFERVLAM